MLRARSTDLRDRPIDQQSMDNGRTQRGTGNAEITNAQIFDSLRQKSPSTLLISKFSTNMVTN